MEHTQSRPDARMRFAAALAILLIAHGGGQRWRSCKLAVEPRAVARFRAVYQKAFYEILRADGWPVQLSLRKLLVSGSASSRSRHYLGEIAQQAQGIAEQSDLAAPWARDGFQRRAVREPG